MSRGGGDEARGISGRCLFCAVLFVLPPLLPLSLNCGLKIGVDIVREHHRADLSLLGFGLLFLEGFLVALKTSFYSVQACCGEGAVI